MQYNQSYCMMEGNQLVILRLEKAPVFAVYDPETKTVTPTDVEDSDRALRALAYALLPSWLYRKQLYK